MIATITLNPSVDKRYMVKNFNKNGVFRVHQVEVTAGGKGLNVARVIKQLGEPVVTLGFLGGANGEFIENELNKMGIVNLFTKIKGETRSCIAILSNDYSQTEILESGPKITKHEIDRFLNEYDNILKKSKIICASGSLPQNIPVDFYSELINRAKKENVKFILDTSGEALKYGLKSSPFLVKPNIQELQDITGVTINTERDLLKSVKILSQYTVEILVISLGSEGSIVMYNDKLYKVTVPKINAINSIGSGDSMIAGFAFAIARRFDFEKIINFASACGTANAMEKGTGMINLKNVEFIMENIVISKL
ncbi:tagatose 6-phosphate kinase [Caloranaerobacter azorensis DSM 13643]|uniref:Tagatose-6-phosphate kinase n=1 Tax=Caloranaerobacter azorensis DSM 13643 TaxID=1121264 RepID=A0A1M5VYF6_9FIRM|nr:1-phosphofructokinase [Caloranaerobacter azorensis]SHH80237.1 tagatose 6-phosphate kinase [Caloranaerobacter azorensis DSM 13643]